MKISPLEISLSMITTGLIVNSFDMLYTGLSTYQLFYINNVRMDKKYEKKQACKGTGLDSQ